MIDRPRYVKALQSFRDSEKLIKVLSGVRRCGKSSILELYKNLLLDDGVAEQSILSLNFESLALSVIDSAEKLNARVVGHSYPEGKRYIFLDEIQLVPQWERAVNSLRLDPRNDIYVTGSNTRLLSSDLASLLSGRYVEIPVYPLSFEEYLRFHPDQPRMSDGAAFNEYLQRGGLPGQFDLHDDPVVQAQYIDGVLNTIITKDIVSHREVRDVDALLKIIRYLGANVGSLSTAKSITDYLKSTGRRISVDTVDNYLTLLEEAYLFYRVKREDLRGKSVMKTSDKFFIVDLGFRAVSQGFGVTNMGHVLENVVYFELARRHTKVSVGKYNAEEVDFVAFTPGQGLAYYQVCLTMADQATRDRELRPLRSLRDAYPKTVLSLDEVREPDYEGIHHKNLIDWLLSEDSRP